MEIDLKMRTRLIKAMLIFLKQEIGTEIQMMKTHMNVNLAI